LIDKTIGDEVMFVLPEVEEDPHDTAILNLGQLMGGLHDLAFNLKGGYRFRISLSYGKVCFFCVEGSGYSEWTAASEPVHVAKRLQDLPDLANPDPVVGAFGVQPTGEPVHELLTMMRQRLSIFAGFASRFDNRLEDTPRSLKGVGDVFCAVLVPRPERVQKSDT